MPLRIPAVTLAVTAILLAGVGPASAQAPAAPEHPSLAAAAAAAAQATPLQPPPPKERLNPVAIGALIGAAGAAVLTAAAAKQYGENEGGKFCIQCLAQWGMITIPTGAGIGAGIGWAVKAGSPRPQPAGHPSAGWRQDAAVTIKF